MNEFSVPRGSAVGVNDTPMGSCSGDLKKGQKYKLPLIFQNSSK